jgi:hypothetical protein
MSITQNRPSGFFLGFIKLGTHLMELYLHPKKNGERLFQSPIIHLLGFIFQKANLIPFLNAVENVQVAMEINDMPAR